MNLQGHRNDAGESRPVAMPLVCLDSAGVWLSCQAIIWISVLAGLFWVLVTYVLWTDKLHCFIIPTNEIVR